MESSLAKPSEFNWEQGHWARAGAGLVRARLIVTGDWAPIRRFSPLVSSDPERVYGDLLPVLRDADLRIANLECPLTGREQPAVKSGAVLKGMPDHIRGLEVVPFELATLANNHVFDHGLEAFQETQELLRAHRIRSVGAGMTPQEAFQPQVLDLAGVRLGVVNFSEGEDLSGATRGPGVFGWDPDRVAAILDDLRPVTDVRVVIFHGGVEYIPFPPPYVVRALERVADAGADLVVAHHPHVPQGIQIHHGTPICYSLGNFLFHQETDLLHRKTGYLVRAGFNRSGLTDLEMIPYRIGPHGLGLLRGGARTAFLADLRRVSEPLARPDGATEAWNGFLRHQGEAGFRREVEHLLEVMASDPAKGAAMFRNRLTTLQHREQWQDLLSRIMAGRIAESPQWAWDLAEEWQTAKIPEDPEW